MSKKLTDEQADQLLRSFVQETRVSDEQIDEIADAPQLWWAVQRNIAAEKEVVATPWPPSVNWLRFLSFTSPVAALLLVAFLVFTFRSTSSTDSALLPQDDLPQSKIVPHEVPSEPAVPQIQNPFSNNAEERLSTPSIERKAQAKSSSSKRTVAKSLPAPETVAKEEIRSEFIDLTYAQRPESGQIVRVKVPQSMKVSLGVVTSVDRPAELVDAEVLVGDDGMTHAIRFISGGGQ